MTRCFRTGTAVLVCTIAAAIAVPLATSAGTGIAAAAVSCDGVGAWDAATAYTGGAEVTYGAYEWAAKWWTQGDTPGNNGQDVWTDAGACGAGGPPTDPPTSTPPPANGLHYFSAPYVMPGESLPDLNAVMAATGQKTFMLAFILAPTGGGCTPTWDGTRPLSSDTLAQPVIDTVRNNGGDVSVSIGGYGGTKLGQNCGTPEATAAAYQQVIDKYSIKAMDFDLEEPEYENLTAVANEIGAAKILVDDNAGLAVSFTVPGTTDGTGYFGQNVLTVAKNDGLAGANFTIMPFDGGFSSAAAQTAALETFHGKLMTTFGWDATTAYAHEGVSLMNGVTDTGEHFYPADFQTVLDYSLSKGLGRFTFWSVGRDRACTDGKTTAVSYCSGVDQADWAFTQFTARFPY